MAGRHSLAVGILAVLALTGSTGARSVTSGGSASATAFSIQVSVPGQDGATAGAVSGPPASSGAGGGFAYPADGSIAQAASISSSVSGTEGGATNVGSATAQVSGVSLFGGEITIGSVSAQATAKASPQSVNGDTNGSGVSGLVVLGQPVGGSTSYGTWGSVSVLQQSAGAYSSSGVRGYAAGTTAVVVALTADHAGAPAGTEIVIGYTNVSAEIHRDVTPPPPPKKVAPKPKPKLKPKQVEPKKSEKTQPLTPIQKIPLGVFPKLTAGGYVFPVYGAASYTDSFGAARADTGWHHGEDIFAPLGAPILAVASGTVYSVGWNDIGGLRLWLQDRAGNEFYYAHLSAYSPLAVNGAQVKAGDVLGFVGNTGDAEHTPYHLHFEIHPTSLLYKGYDGAVAPYPYLNAWKHLTDLPLTSVSGWAPLISDSSHAPKPGAILLQSHDISSATGLEPASLRRAMRATGSVAGDGSLAGLARSARKRLEPLARAVPGP
ncbi:MAG TPA: M23 family metallopeptidase [Gaiellaceae bacterium]|nr:M23 family metallopeptidase [Gaiellaceae bacterium]